MDGAPHGPQSSHVGLISGREADRLFPLPLWQTPPKTNPRTIIGQFTGRAHPNGKMPLWPAAHNLGQRVPFEWPSVPRCDGTVRGNLGTLRPCDLLPLDYRCHSRGEGDEIGESRDCRSGQALQVR